MVYGIHHRQGEQGNLPADMPADGSHDGGNPSTQDVIRKRELENVKPYAR